MRQNGILEAVVTLIESGGERTPEGALPGLLDVMPAELQLYCRALLYHEPPLHLSLNHWDLGLLNEESARAMLADAGGSAEAAQHAHLVGIAMEGGGLPAVAGFSPGDRGVAVYVVDAEYRTVKKVAWDLRSWLRERFVEGARPEVHAALTEIIGGPVEPVDLAFEAIDGAAWESLDRLPDEETDELLRAGGHSYFCTSEEGTAVAIHGKGVRFVGANGKRKAKNVKGFAVTAGSISEDGSYALVLNSYRKDGPGKVNGARLTRFALPAGTAQEYEVEGFWPDYAHLRDDHILHAHEGEVILYRMEQQGLAEKQRLRAVDIDIFPKLRAFFHGRLFLVRCARSFLVGAFKDGELRWIGKGAGTVSDTVVRGEALHVMKDYAPALLKGHRELYANA